MLCSIVRHSEAPDPGDSLALSCMIKADIVDRVAREAGIPKIVAEAAVERILETVKRSLARGERIELRGFGVFEVRPRKRGIGRNPRTGEEVEIASGKTTRFKPGKNLSDLPPDLPTS